MPNQDDLSVIKKEIEEFFRQMGANSEVRLEIIDLTVRADVQMEEPGMFIGHSGQVLAAMQYLLKAILRRKTTEAFYLDLDINDYRRNKYAYIQEMARDTANEVALTRREKELPPMPAAERRIVHMELAQRVDVTTESVGEGEERRIVIKPATF